LEQKDPTKKENSEILSEKEKRWGLRGPWREVGSRDFMRSSRGEDRGLRLSGAEGLSVRRSHGQQKGEFRGNPLYITKMAVGLGPSRKRKKESKGVGGGAEWTREPVGSEETNQSPAS